MGVVKAVLLVRSQNQGGGGGGGGDTTNYAAIAAANAAAAAEAARLAELERKRKVVIYTDINAITATFYYEDGSTEIKPYFAKQDLPPNEYGVSQPIPIKADVFYVEDDTVVNNVKNVFLSGKSKIQAPSLKSIPRTDTTSKAIVELPNPSSVSVYFGFQTLAGIAGYNIYEKDTGKFAVRSGTVDLHSTSDALVQARGVELASGLDSTKNYMLELYHTGLVTNDLNLDHKIYVGEVQIHRISNSANSVVEAVSNNGFLNNSYIDNGTRNSLTGRSNYIEFFDVQLENCDGIVNNFKIKSNAINIRKVELNNGKKFQELNETVDWTAVTDANLNLYVNLTFVPKKNASIRITYETTSSILARQITLTQPIDAKGNYDRYTDIYVQNEAIYMSIQSNIQ